MGTVTVSGDSLAGDGILDGDTLIVQRVVQTAEVRSGRLVIAQLPTGKCVVKRIYFEDGKIVLRSSNSRYQDLVFEKDELMIEGLVKELKRVLD